MNTNRYIIIERKKKLQFYTIVRI